MVSFLCVRNNKGSTVEGNSELLAMQRFEPMTCGNHLRLAVMAMSTARPSPLADKAMVVGGGGGDVWVYMG
jgi:hypothetical protein